jgi:hypothetical protein
MYNGPARRMMCRACSRNEKGEEYIQLIGRKARWEDQWEN